MAYERIGISMKNEDERIDILTRNTLSEKSGSVEISDEVIEKIDQRISEKDRKKRRLAF